jgi:hypothetical protein
LPLSMEALDHAVGVINLRHKLSVVWCEGGLNAHIYSLIFQECSENCRSILEKFNTHIFFRREEINWQVLLDYPFC